MWSSNLVGVRDCLVVSLYENVRTDVVCKFSSQSVKSILDAKYTGAYTVCESLDRSDAVLRKSC